MRKKRIAFVVFTEYEITKLVNSFYPLIGAGGWGGGSNPGAYYVISVGNYIERILKK